MIQHRAVSQIWRSWSQDLATPPKVFLIESVNHILGLGFLMIDVKLSWPQMQFHGIFLIFFMEWRIIPSSWGASFIPCFSWGIDWLSLFWGLTSARRIGETTFALYLSVFPSRPKRTFFFLIEDFRLFFSFLDVLAATKCDLNKFAFFFFFLILSFVFLIFVRI